MEGTDIIRYAFSFISLAVAVILLMLNQPPIAAYVMFGLSGLGLIGPMLLKLLGFAGSATVQAASATSQGIKTAASATAKGIGTGVSNVQNTISGLGGIGNIGSSVSSPITENPIGFSFGTAALIFGLGVVILGLGAFGVIGPSSQLTVAGISISSIAGFGLLIIGGFVAFKNFSSKTVADTTEKAIQQDNGLFSKITLGIGVLALIGMLIAYSVTTGVGQITSDVFKYTGIFLTAATVIYGITFLSQKFDQPGKFTPTTMFRLLYYFLPYGLVTYTALADLFNAQFKYFGGIITSFITIAINHGISKVLGQPTTDSNYCGIPGLSSLGSSVLPQSMLFNLTTLSYVASCITEETERDSKYTIPLWTFLIATFLVSSFTSIRNGCFDVKNGNHTYILTEMVKNITKSETAGIAATLTATLATSLLVGGLAGFGAARATKEGFAGYVDPKKIKEKEKKDQENIVNVSTALSEVCPAISEDQIVAEIYQNGKKIGTSLND